MARSSTDLGVFRPLLFGTELEILVKPKSHLQGCNWDVLVGYLSTVLNENKIPTEVVEDTKTFEFKKWAITADGTIKQDREAQEWGLELVSRIGYTNPAIPGAIAGTRNSTTRLWECLTTEFDIVESGPGYESCGTHVHVSVHQLSYKPESLESQPFEYYRLLAKAVVYFERCIDSLMPAHRRRNKFCRSNRYNTNLKSLDIPQIFQRIDNIQEKSQTPGGQDGFTQLADLLCPELEDGSSRYYRWNFTGLTNSNPKRRTVEFRQPPGSTTAHQATLWPQIALAFVHGAALYNLGIKYVPSTPTKYIPGALTIDSRAPATMDRLGKMLATGSRYVYDLDSGHIQLFLEGKEKLEDGPYDEEPFGPEDDGYMQAKTRTGEIVTEKIEAGAEAWLTALPFSADPADGE